MKILSLFNNKGGVGKTTLTYHLAHILATPIEEGGCGKRVLLMDLDPQSNLTIFSMNEDKVGKIWDEEQPFIEDDNGFESAKKKLSQEEYNKILNNYRTIHFLLRPTEEGISDEDVLPPPVPLNESETLHILPGRLSLYKYEDIIAQRWSGAYLGESLALRAITKIRNIARDYAQKYQYDFVIMDTSPSLGTLNKIIISLADGFIIPTFPDVFSWYGIRNIGTAIKKWDKEFSTMMSLLSDEKTKDFPKSFVQFLGYTIFNAKKYAGQNDWDLSQAHYNYAQKFPEVIYNNISIDKPVPEDIMKNPIGGTAIMHSHNTFPSQAQKYKCPIWELPSSSNNSKLDSKDSSTIMGNQQKYFNTKEQYKQFADALLERVEYLEVEKQNEEVSK